MSRYRFLRAYGCDPVCAGFIALLNWARGYPPNEIRFLGTTIEMQE